MTWWPCIHILDTLQLTLFIACIFIHCKRWGLLILVFLPVCCFFFRSDMMMPLGPFGVALGGGCTACDGGVCVRGDWSPPVKNVADKFLVFTHCLSGFWLVGIGFSAHLRFLVWVVWVVWLFCGWPGLSGCLLGLLCLVLCLRLCSACLRGLMDDETGTDGWWDLVSLHFLVHVAANTFSCNPFKH